MQSNQQTNQTGFLTGSTNPNPQFSFGSMGGGSNQGSTQFGNNLLGQKPLGTSSGIGQSSNTLFTQQGSNMNPPTTSTTGPSFFQANTGGIGRIPQSNPLSSTNPPFNSGQPSSVNQPGFGQTLLTGSSTNYDPKQIGTSLLGIPIYSGGVLHGGLYGTGQPNPKREAEIYNIIEVFQSYFSSYDCRSPLNAFKVMLYNRIPKGYDSYVSSYQNYSAVKRTEDGKEVPVDFSLWQKALKSNPNPKVLFPTQISSPVELIQRATTSRVFLLSGIETISNLKSTLISINNTYQTDMEKVLARTKIKSNRIKERHLNLVVNLEIAATKLNYVRKDYNLQNATENKINSIKTNINENPNYLPNVQETCANISNLNFVNDSYSVDSQSRDYDNIRREKNLSVLAEHKRIFDATVRDLKTSQSYLKFYINELAAARMRNQRVLPK